MDLYDFYFDETFHTRKITYINKKLNIDDDVNFYVGCCIGSSEWDNIQEDLLLLEKKYKHKLNIREDQELKSTSLINCNKLQYGVCSLRKEVVDFYTELFTILNNHVKIHFSILNKYEFLLKNIFPDDVWLRKHGIDCKGFFYTLTKLIILHPELHIIDILLGKGRDRNKRRALVTKLKKRMSKIENINKKREEVQAIQSLINIFQTTLIPFTAINKLEWNYVVSLIPFKAFLQEKQIPMRHLYIDKEEKTLDAAEILFGNNASMLDSKKSIQIRVCDWIACFISRIMLSYSRGYINANTCFDLSETVCLLDKRCFQFSERTKSLTLEMIELFLRQQEGHWSTVSGMYSDGVLNFYAFLRYCYVCFQENIKPTPEEFNNCLAIEANKIIHDDRYAAKIKEDNIG